jgi:hypothetical protein
MDSVHPRGMKPNAALTGGRVSSEGDERLLAVAPLTRPAATLSLKGRGGSTLKADMRCGAGFP